MNEETKHTSPDCYKEGEGVYPLCVGIDGRDIKTVTDCKNCCLYEWMENEGGYDYYDR